jgi:hypothetical protein
MAHISCSKNGKNTFFGDSKKHLKTYKPQKRPIYERPMRNITSELIHKPEFAHVRFITAKRKEIA